MTKKSEDRRNQPEFFFVFNGEPSTQQPVQSKGVGSSPAERNVLTPDVIRSHRDQLIEELREFGC